jgi:peptide/nickel transport system permease protein
MSRRGGLPSWVPWLVLRVVSGAATVLALSALVFFATHALPSDPARVILGPDAPEETIRILQQQLGLDRPIVDQYVTWIARVTHGDLGTSLDSRRPVGELIGYRLENSLSLVSIVVSVAAPLALFLGVALGARRDTKLDRLVVSLLIGAKAIPVFAVGIALVIVFATTVFPIFPAVSLLDSERPALAQPRFLALPLLTLLLSSLPYPIRLVRTSVIEALEADYVVLARLRGIPERRILLRHVLPNALVPAVQGAALMLSVMLGGSVITEVLFNYPGIGSMMHSAVESRDLPVIQALVLIIAVGVVFINLAADFVCLLLTPRLRTATPWTALVRWRAQRATLLQRITTTEPPRAAREAS